MVERMAIKLVHKLEKEQLINREDIEDYEYAMITLMERIITMGTIILIAIAYMNILPTICFLFFFLSLRKRTGGYHSDRFWKCYVVTVLVYIVIIKMAILFLEHLTIPIQRELRFMIYQCKTVLSCVLRFMRTSSCLMTGKQQNISLW